jgi:putative hydrolase of the HAD superfamily
MPELLRPSTIFFDLDETLIDNTSDFSYLIAEVFKTYFPQTVVDGSMQPSVASAMRSSAGYLWKNMFACRQEGKDALTEIFRHALVKSELDESQAVAMGRRFSYQASQGTKLKPGAVQLLTNLRSSGMTIGIITNGIEAMQHEKIGLHGLGELVDKVIVSEETGAHKPHMRVFEYALRQLNASAAQAWHVGDHPLNDVTGAINCGLTGVLFAPTDDHLDNYSIEDAEIRAPDYTVRNLHELNDLLSLTN